MARLNIDMKNEIYSCLQVEASREGRSVSDVVRVLVNQFLAGKRREEELEIEMSKLQESRGVQ